MAEDKTTLVDAQAQIGADRTAQHASTVRDLEERVRVLERIVTDRGYDVASQIEALRDTRRADEVATRAGERAK